MKISEKEYQKFKGDLDKEFILLKDEFQNKLQETDELIQKKLNESFESVKLALYILAFTYHSGNTMIDNKEQLEWQA